jgi:hypothetical protein
MDIRVDETQVQKQLQINDSFKIQIMNDTPSNFPSGLKVFQLLNSSVLI